MIDKNICIGDLLALSPEVEPFLNSRGIKGLTNQDVLKQVKSMPLTTVLRSKKIDVSLFLEQLNILLGEGESEDATLKTPEALEKPELKLTGLLPCPVRIPLLEAFEKGVDTKGVEYKLKAASEGLDWLKESVKEAKDSTVLDDIFISAGFDLFFEEALMGHFKTEKVFEDYSGLEAYNKDFDNDDICLKDPDNDYSMLGVVPAVFMVNKDILGDKPVPKTWADVLKPEYKGLVSLPVSDFDLFNAILLHIGKEFGDEGIYKLGESLIASLHPSQMIKNKKADAPAISIMPWFFSKMTLPGSPLVAIWPEDGAIISPIFMLTKAESRAKAEPIAKFFASKEVGEILSHRGKFPTVNPEVDNNLEGKTFKWLGWEYIKSHDIGSLIEHYENIFNQGVQ